MSSYDAIAELYDPWSASVVEDVAFYLEEARRSGGPVVELGVGTGRIAVPIAADGIRIIGVDSSRGMLDVCARRAALAGVAVDLRVGDLREPPVTERVPLVICPFRSLLHMHTDEDRLSVLAAAYKLLLPGGRFVFDVFSPDAADIAETNDRWLEREPGIFEHALWDESARTLTLTVRDEERETTMALAWLSPDEWRSLLERGRLRGRGLLRLVRPEPLRGPGRHRLGREASLELSPTPLRATRLPAPARELVESDRAGEGDVQGIRVCRERNRGPFLAAQEDLFRQAFAFRAENERRRPREVELLEWSPAARHERDPTPGCVVETDERHAEERAHRSPQCLRSRRVGGAFGGRDERRTESVGRTHQRADVPGITDVPERETGVRQRRVR